MMTQFFQVLKPAPFTIAIKYSFYDDSILSGTKTDRIQQREAYPFYDDSILSGTKTVTSS